MTEETTKKKEHEEREAIQFFNYRIRFRQEGQELTVSSKIEGLQPNEVVMVKTDHGLEPAILISKRHQRVNSQISSETGVPFIVRRSTLEEKSRFENIDSREAKARKTCLELIEKHNLSMKLIRVERYFDSSKMIFYFTAENRVDFRELVKDLVREFRTRVEMRQVGVRHETKMVGGLGACGRELCCSSFMKTFDSVSIKMAKEQDLPLNPSRISGVCNRLLCCLTYEYDTYREERKGMPKCGRRIIIGDEEMQVVRQIPLSGEIVVSNQEGGCRSLSREEWSSFRPVKPEKPKKKKKKKRN